MSKQSQSSVIIRFHLLNFKNYVIRLWHDSLNAVFVYLGPSSSRCICPINSFGKFLKVTVDFFCSCNSQLWHQLQLQDPLSTLFQLLRTQVKNLFKKNCPYRPFSKIDRKAHQNRLNWSIQKSIANPDQSQLKINFTFSPWTQGYQKSAIGLRYQKCLGTVFRG